MSALRQFSLLLEGAEMMRTFFRSAVYAALFLAAGLVAEASYGQNWNHGFGPRSYGYTGVPYGRSYSQSTAYGYRAPFITSRSPYYGYSNYGYSTPYGGYYPSYYYQGVQLGGFSSGVYTYYPSPSLYYYNYRPTYYSRPLRGGRIRPGAYAW
jgi:hypothetical protein